MHKSFHIFIDPLIARAKGFVQRNPVFSIAVVAAFISACIVHPDKEYLDYFDWKTLTCLFCTLAVVGALRNILFFTMLAHNIVRLFRTTRTSILALAYITFIGSMFIANDMALLTFLPLGYFVLSSTGNEKHLAFTFIMQNIAANLGGMLTPFGNPQNLYLYTKFTIDTMEFMKIMAPPFAVAVLLITICCLCVESTPLRVEKTPVQKHTVRMCIYLALFALSVVIVFRLVPYYYGLAVITGVLLVMDRKALKKVDYPLLLTFTAFFIFSGNMSRIEWVHDVFKHLLSKDTLTVSTLSCQFIRNVPSAILLSQFTENYRDLLVGVNIGGTGTLIASLASLITFREYQRLYPDKVRRYLLLFTAYNASFLGILLAFMHLIK
ncbi:MAG: hypothetical protein IKN52_16290 [Victivallales bacterium]|nr:hypothetical protein [Victivallales bacterium]